MLYGVRLGPVADGESGRKQHIHRREDCPAVARRAGHAAQRISEARADDEDRKNLQEVRERRRILIGMRAVGVEESAAVGAQHLDGFLRGHRALADGLRLEGCSSVCAAV